MSERCMRQNPGKFGHFNLAAVRGDRYSRAGHTSGPAKQVDSSELVSPPKNACEV